MVQVPMFYQTGHKRSMPDRLSSKSPHLFPRNSLLKWLSQTLSWWIFPRAGELFSRQFMSASVGKRTCIMVSSIAGWLSTDACSMWGTGIVNLAGSFALGCIAMGLGNQRNHPWMLFLGVGMCGGFTTFSTLSMEIADFIHAKRWGLATAYGLGSLLCGWLAFVCGAWIVGCLRAEG